MKILIAVSSKEYSKSTLNMGMQVAKAFNASTTILDVGEKINDFGLKDVSLLRERMESWNIDRPGIDVLEWAFKYLSKNNFIELSSVEAGFSKNTIVETKTGRLEVFLKGTFCDNVKLILRNGDIISELRDEVETGAYDVTIIGSGLTGLSASVLSGVPLLVRMMFFILISSLSEIERPYAPPKRTEGGPKSPFA